jgi:uncharacterized protein (DUF58 family)
MPQLPQSSEALPLRHLSRLGLRARTAVEGLISGIHKSRSHGWNVEFADFREYTKGDDIRHIDWKVYARTERFFIKQFEEETNMRVYIVVDQSRSMAYTEGGTTKLEYACSLAAALSYLLIRQGDSVGLVTFDNEMREYLPPRNSPRHLELIWKVLEGIEAGGGTDVTANLHYLAARVRRRGLVILISDLFDRTRDVLKGLAHFRHKKFEVITFHVLDPAELEFPFEGNTLFLDMETDRSVETSPGSIRGNYLSLFDEFLEGVRRGCTQTGVDYHMIRTDTPVHLALLHYLSLRLKRQG